MGTEQKAFKTILKNGATVIGNLLSVGMGGVKMIMKETTHHGLTDPYVTRRPVLGDAQPWKFKVQMTTAQFAALWAMFDPDGNGTTWSVIYPFSAPITVAITGFLAEIGIPDAEVDGILEVELTLECSGKPTVS